MLCLLNFVYLYMASLLWRLLGHTVSQFGAQTFVSYSYLWYYKIWYYYIFFWGGGGAIISVKIIMPKEGTSLCLKLFLFKVNWETLFCIHLGIGIYPEKKKYSHGGGAWLVWRQKKFEMLFLQRVRSFSYNALNTKKIKENDKFVM